MRCSPRELHVRHEAVGIIYSLRVIKDQTLVEKVCLQRVEGGAELGGELPDTFKIGFADFWLSRWIDVGSGAELGEVGMNIGGIEEKALSFAA